MCIAAVHLEKLVTAACTDDDGQQDTWTEEYSLPIYATTRQAIETILVCSPAGKGTFDVLCHYKFL